MKKILLFNKQYLIVKNINDCFNKEELENLWTDYFDDFDYILGDYSYDKMRLKGFCDKKNNRYNEINDIDYLDEYICNYCNYQGSYFLLKKIA